MPAPLSRATRMGTPWAAASVATSPKPSWRDGMITMSAPRRSRAISAGSVVYGFNRT